MSECILRKLMKWTIECDIDAMWNVALTYSHSRFDTTMMEIKPYTFDKSRSYVKAFLVTIYVLGMYEEERRL